MLQMPNITTPVFSIPQADALDNGKLKKWLEDKLSMDTFGNVCGPEGPTGNSSLLSSDFNSLLTS